MSNLLRIRSLVQQYILRQDIERTTGEARGVCACVVCVWGGGLTVLAPTPRRTPRVRTPLPHHPPTHRHPPEFLYAASAGNESKMRQMLQHGCPVDSADYGKRGVSTV